MFKQRRIAKRLLARAEADPAIRADWMQAHKMLLIGFQVAGVGPNAHDPDHWQDSFKDCLEAERIGGRIGLIRARPWPERPVSAANMSGNGTATA